LKTLCDLLIKQIYPFHRLGFWGRLLNASQGLLPEHLAAVELEVAGRVQPLRQDRRQSHFCSGRRFLLRFCSTFDRLDQKGSTYTGRFDSTVHVSSLFHEEVVDEHGARQRRKRGHHLPLSPGIARPYCNIIIQS